MSFLLLDRRGALPERVSISATVYTYGMGEEDDPVVTDELVEVDLSAGGLSVEVGGDGAETERGSTLFLSHCELLTSVPVYVPRTKTGERELVKQKKEKTIVP